MNISVKLFSLNVRGLRDFVKRRAVFSFLEGVGFDVCFLQEVHLRDGGDVVRFKREWDKGESVWGIGGVHSTGVGILFGNREMKVEGTFVVMQGRVLGVDVTFRDSRYRLVVVYGPQAAADRREMVDCLTPLCVTNRHLVIGGDFNIDLGIGGDSSAGAITGLMACHGLVDGGLHTTPTMAGPTWRNSRGSTTFLYPGLWVSCLGACCLCSFRTTTGCSCRWGRQSASPLCSLSRLGPGRVGR